MKATGYKSPGYKFFDKVCLRTLATLFMFVGILLFLFPYFSGSLSNGKLFLILGAVVAFACGVLRCTLIEGECHEDKTSGHARQS